MIKLQGKKLGMAVMLFLAFVFVASLNTKHVQAADYTSAQTLPVNGAWSSEHWLTNTDSEQWYKIVVPSDGKLTYKMMGYTYVRYQLYNEDLSARMHYWDESSDGTETSPDTDTYNLALSKGTYYLKVYKGNNGKYKLNASFTSYNVNDGNAVSYDSPQIVSLNSTITGALTETDGEDWYRITIPTSGYYHYQVSAYTYVRYQLYNEDLSTKMHYWDESSSGTETSPDTDTYDLVLSKGTYYFKVYKGDTGKYTFRFSALDQSSCNHEYKTSEVASTYTSKGYTKHECTKCGHVYKDNYKAKLTLGKPSIRSISAGRKKVTVSWSSVKKASGYQVSCKINGKTRTVKVNGRKKTRVTVKKLKSKKKCVVRIRAYKKVGKKTVYSKWSAKRSVKIK